MSAVAIVRALLLAHGPVAAIVGDKVFPGDLPPGQHRPAILLREISQVEQPTVSQSEQNALVTSRVQVTVLAEDYPGQKALLKAAKLGAGTHTGTVAGYQVRSVTRGPVGPDLSDVEAKSFEQSRDFLVTYLEPN